MSFDPNPVTVAPAPLACGVMPREPCARAIRCARSAEPVRADLPAPERGG